MQTHSDQTKPAKGSSTASMTEAVRTPEQRIATNVSLATRLALLELLTLGSVPKPTSALSLSTSGNDDAASYSARTVLLSPSNVSLVARFQDAHSRMLNSIERYKPIVQFVDQYRINHAYLRPQLSTVAAATAASSQSSQTRSSFSSTDTTPTPTFDTVPPQAVITLLLDAESDLRQLERDLRACDTYAHRDIAGAGDLARHEHLRPRLETIKTQLAQTLTREQDNERTALALMQRYQAHVDALSQLFIHWDMMLTTVEDSLGRLERLQAR